MPGDTINQERDARAWALRLSGATYAEIGQALKVSSQRAEQICKRMLVKHRPSEEQIDQHRQTEALRLDRLLRAVWPDALKGNHGAIDRALRIADRRAKLLGLDAPTRQELSGAIDLTDTRPALAALAAALPEPSAEDSGD